jgi:DNA-binding LacI/PurR family transcriptional regulator
MSIVNIARQFGYSIIFQFSEKSEKNEKSALEYFDYIGVDGIVLFSVGSDSDEYENYLKSINKPLVLIGNQMFDLPFIGIDDFSAMYTLTEKIAQTITEGSITYFAPILKQPLHSKNAQKLRLAGFTEAVKSMKRDYRIVTNISDIGKNSGIICATDHYAMSVLKHLEFPKDIVIAGFDNISLLKNAASKVLTVEYSTDKIAEECMNYILGRRYEPQIEYKLVYNSD